MRSDRLIPALRASAAQQLLAGALLFFCFSTQSSAGRLLAQAAAAAVNSSAACKELDQSQLLGSSTLELEGCYFFPEVGLIARDTSITLLGPPVYSTDVAALDLNDSMWLLELGPGVNATLTNLNLTGMLLFPPGTSKELSPAAFVQPSNTSFVSIVNCSILLHCDLLDQILEWARTVLGDNATAGNDGGLSIESLSLQYVKFTNTTLSCSPGKSVDVQGIVSTASELGGMVTDLELLQAPGSLVFSGPIQLNRSSWITHSISHNLAMGGPRMTADRVWFDLAQDAGIFENAVAKVEVHDVVAINSCVILYNNTLLASPLYGIFSRGRGSYLVSNATLVVPNYDMLFYMYWGIVAASPFQRLEVLSQFLSYAGIRNLSVGEITPDRAIININSSATVSFNNVTFTHLLPDNAPDGFSINPELRYCSTSNTVVSSNVSTRPNVYFASNASDLKTALITVTRGVATLFPPVILIYGNSSLPATAYDQSGAVVDLVSMVVDLLITGPMSSQVFTDDKHEGNPTNVSLDLKNMIGALSVANSDVNLYIQRLTLINPVALDLITGSQRPSNEATATQISALPLWAFKLSKQRLSPQLLLNSVTMVLVAADFLQIYYAAGRGAGWKTGSKANEMLILQTEVFDVVYLRPDAILFNSYVGWGLNATNFMVKPATPVDPLPVSTSTPPSAPRPPPEGSNNDSSAAIGIGVGVGVGGAVLFALLSLAYWKWGPKGKGMVEGEAAKGKESKDRSGTKDSSPLDQPSSIDENGVHTRTVSLTGHGKGSHASLHAIRSHNGMADNVGMRGSQVGTTAHKGLDPAVMAMWQQLYESPTPNGNGGGAGAAMAAAASGRDRESTSYSNSKHGANDSPVVTGRLQQQLDHAEVAAATASAGVVASPVKAFDPHKEVAQLAEDLSSEGDKLTLLEAIGQGGFGTVYRGRWRNLEVAVKTVLFSENIAARGRTTAQPHQRAILEAAVCSSVMHPNVVITYHYDISAVRKGTTGLNGMTIDESMGNTDWKLYLVQEYCHASMQDALRNFLLHDKATMAPDMDLVLTVLLDIARGMAYIHSKHIIHGDLSPGNVLIKQDPESPIGVVGKITDFGLCNKIRPDQSHISNITNGTPFYVAPEVVASSTLTKSSDVYSFGVLMWELYRCMPPWVKTENGFAQNKRFRRFPADSPRAYVLLCARCLSKDGKARPSFEDVLVEMGAMHAAYLAGYDSLEDPNAHKAPAKGPTAASPGLPPAPHVAAATPAAPLAAEAVRIQPPRSTRFLDAILKQEDEATVSAVAGQQLHGDGAPKSLFLRSTTLNRKEYEAAALRPSGNNDKDLPLPSVA